MRYLLFILFSMLLFTACQKTSSDENSEGKVKRYDFRGKVLTFDKNTKMASIEHEAIPGYMEAMTMDFEIRKPEWAWETIIPGAVINGDLMVDNVNGKYWVEVKGVVEPRDGQAASPIREDKAAEGKDIVDFTLTNQDGKPVSPKDFRGKALAITFIYSECPLPEYCILMSKNFSDAANEIANNDEFKDKFRLLSISFDPKRDTPEKLKQYGLGYLGKDSKAKDFTVWQLASGDDKKIREIADFFGFRYEIDEKDKTQFNHSLRTIVVSPEGKITKVFSGNEWKSIDLFNEMKKTLPK